MGWVIEEGFLEEEVNSRMEERCRDVLPCPFRWQVWATVYSNKDM